jgi:alanyl-tRNA synthetase
MGFERVVAVLQGKTSNYESDIFMPVIEAIAAKAGKKYKGGNEPDDVAMRVIADHIRSLAFSIADGIMPSNDGRGYVIRRILRRALRFGQKLGFEKAFLTAILPALESVLGSVFPELGRNMPRVREVIEHEEARYFTTLHAGMRELDTLIAAAKASGAKRLDGKDIFHLYDSLGFPAEIAEEVAKDEGLTADMEGFRTHMEEQKNRGRQSWKGAEGGELDCLPPDLAPTVYCGDEAASAESAILLLVHKNALTDTLRESDEGYLISGYTPFYAEGGGQLADHGEIRSGDSIARVLDVVRFGELFLHRVRIEKGAFKKGDAVQLSVDAERKKAIARHHSATHLLQQALIEVLGEHVAQSGSLVTPDRLRFDFSHFSAVKAHELERAEEIVNRIVCGDHPITCAVMGREEAIKGGATAIFGEKYGDTVRVVSMGDFSRELCGGTHVARTGEIGLIKIIAETSVASGTRRIEAVTGLPAIARIQEEARILSSLSAKLNLPKEELLPRLGALQDELHATGKALEEARTALAVIALDKAAQSAPEADGIRIIIARQDGAQIKVIKEGVDDIRNRYKDSIVLVGSAQSDGKCMLILAASGKALEHGFDARKTVSEIALHVDGTGGGRKDMAQAGGKNPAHLDRALDAAREIIARELGG